MNTTDNVTTTADQIYKQIFVETATPMVMFDTSSAIFDANKAFVHHSGFSLDELKRLKLDVLFNILPSEAARLSELASPGDSLHKELALMSKTGHSSSWSCKFVFAEGSDGGSAKFGLILETLTGGGNTQLNNDESARAAAETKTNYIATVSQELRQPISGILGMTELLRMEQLNPESEEIASSIFLAAQNAMHLVNDMFNYSNMDAGKLSVESYPVSIPTLAREVVRIFKPVAKNKNLEFTLELDSNLPDPLWTDGVKVSHALSNIVQNALKFTRKGSVAIRVVNDGIVGETAQIVFIVKDTGVGILAEKQAQIFLPFCQISVTSTRKHGGTGLGLTIAKNLVEFLGGSIIATSALKEGSEFRLTVPMGLGPKFSASEENNLSAAH